MKKMKKVLSMLLAVIMVLAMAAPSFAANDGSITITNATNGRNYFAYKLFGANPSGEGNVEGAKIAYTATPKQVSLLTDKSETELAALEAGATLTTEYFVFTKVAGSGNYNVEQKAGTQDEALISYLNGFFQSTTTGENEFATTKWEIKDSKYNELFGAAIPGNVKNGQVVFSDLDYGYYFITSSLGTALTITSTNKNAVVIDKNQGPHWDDKEENDGGKKIIGIGDKDVKKDGKGVDKVSANYQDEIKYEVQFQATDYAGEKKVTEYILKDELAKEMSYVTNTQGNVVVNVKLESKKDDVLVADTDYTVTTTIDKENNKNQFELSIPWTNADGTFKYPFTDSVQTITVTYSAIVEDDAVIAGAGNKNTATLLYRTEEPEDPDNPDQTPKEPYQVTEQKSTYTYVYALGINKTDKEGNGLENAKFTLTDKQGNPIFVKGRTVENDGEGNAVYLYDPASNDPSVTQSNEVISPKNGCIIVKGIAAGTYKVKETEAPAGYNLLKEEKEVTTQLTETNITETTKTVYYDEEGTLLPNGEGATVTKEINTTVPMEAASFLTVVNFAGTLLPSTGGIGTTIFYAAGIILMAGAVFFVVRRRRA